ncbi:MAG: hypothetical protein R6W90_16275 [Ignavibacteriaceae bacterium]
MIDKKHFLIIGQVSFALAMIIKHFLPEGDIFSFMEGLFTGLTLVGHTAFLLSNSKHNLKRDGVLF